MRRGVLVLLVLVLAACAREATPTPQRSGAEGPATVTRTELDVLAERISGGARRGEPDPRLGLVGERTAACMAEAGFDYHPVPVAAADTVAAPLLLTREHAARHGYGDTVPAVPGGTPSRWAVPGQEQDAANGAYRDGLDAAALEEYWVRLLGTPEDPGCQQAAMSQVFADVVVPERFHAAQAALRGVELRVERDPRVVGAVAHWAACMAAAGYPGLGDRDGGRDLVADRAAQIDVPFGTPFSQVAAEHAAELAAVQAFEVEVALADATCLEETGFAAVWDEVRRALHAQVLAEHGPALEEWARWAEQVRAGAL